MRYCQHCNMRKLDKFFHSLPIEKRHKNKLKRELTKREYREKYMFCISCANKIKRVREWKLNNKDKFGRAKTLKQKLVELYGGKCILCGYSSSIRGLHFHHLNPGNKEYNISQGVSIGKDNNEILDECSKCVLLCANCHAEVESGIIKIPQDVEVSRNKVLAVVV